MKPKKPKLRNYRVEYVYRGEVYATVVEAESSEDAIAKFNRENPHVRAVNAY